MHLRVVLREVKRWQSDRLKNVVLVELSLYERALSIFSEWDI
jgi:hypothetical protein